MDIKKNGKEKKRDGRVGVGQGGGGGGVGGEGTEKYRKKELTHIDEKRSWMKDKFLSFTAVWLNKIFHDWIFSYSYERLDILQGRKSSFACFLYTRKSST